MKQSIGLDSLFRPLSYLIFVDCIVAGNFPVIIQFSLNDGKTKLQLTKIKALSNFHSQIH